MSEPLRPKRRVVPASEVIEALDRPVQAKEAPKDRKTLTELARIERQLHLADLALNYYQEKLEKGISLDPEEQRLFLAHQDSLRKLEMSRAALVAKADHAKKTDIELAMDMKNKGMTREQVLLFFPHLEEKL